MTVMDRDNVGELTMSDATFRKFSAFTEAELGIKMPPTKKTMLQCRLGKRMRALGIDTLEEYYDHVFESEEGKEHELEHMIDVITTNKTEFFREPSHFDYLFQTVLPEINASFKAPPKKIKLWSSACSSGEEPYTLAMVLSEFIQAYPGVDYSILGTDICTKVLKKAVNAVYPADSIVPISQQLRKKYLLRGKGKNDGVVRIVPELRNRVRFARLNLMSDDFGIREQMDVIFCRNVIIYFDRPTQEKLLNQLCLHLRPDGYLFMGHSETLHGLRLPLVPVGPTIYRRVY